MERPSILVFAVIILLIPAVPLTTGSGGSDDPLRIVGGIDEIPFPGSGNETDPYVIENLTIDGTGEGTCLYLEDLEHTIIRNCTFINASGNNDGSHRDSGIHLRECNNITIENCHIRGCAENGLILIDSGNVTVSNSSFMDNYRDISSYGNSDDLSVSNCAITGNRGTAVFSEGDHLRLRNNLIRNKSGGMRIVGSHSRVIDNDFLNISVSGIRIFSSHGLFRDNRIDNCEFAGITLREARRNTFENNRIERCDTYGIDIFVGSSQNDFYGNRMVDCGFYDMEYENNSIPDNNTVNGKPVIRLDGVKNETIGEGAGQIILKNCKNITVEDADIDGGNVGIQCGRSRNIHLVSNRISNMTQNGIECRNMEGPLYIENNTIGSVENNGMELYSNADVRGGNNSLSYCGKNGIHITFCDRTLLRNNAFRGNNRGFYTYGCLVDSFENVFEGCNIGAEYENYWGNTIRGNRFLNCSTYGLIFRRAGANLIDNSFVECGDVGVYFLSGLRSVVENNTISGGSVGFLMESCRNITFRNNRLNGSGFRIIGYTRDHWDMIEIDRTNQVNTLPVDYVKNSQGFDIEGGTNQLILFNCSNVTVRDLDKDNIGPHLAYCSNLEINGCSSDHNPLGMHLFECTDVVIENVEINNNTEAGILMEESARVEILDSVITGNGDSDIKSSDTMGITMYGNLLGPRGLHLDDDPDISSSHNIGSNNTVSGLPLIYGVGIRDREIGGDLGQIIIVDGERIRFGDMALNGPCRGLHLISCKDTLIDNITLKDSNHEGIRLVECENIMIDSSWISGCENYGMESIRSSHLTVEDTEFKHNGVGLRTGGIMVVIDNSTITDNLGFGLILDRGEDCRIRNNTIRGNGGTGGYVDGSTIRIQGNLFEENGEINLHLNGDTIKVENNTFRNSPTNLKMTCFKTTVSVNLIENASSTNSELINCRDCEISYNDIKGCKDTGLFLDYSSRGNTIHQNNFLFNGINSLAEGKGNFFHLYGEGNYWSDYERLHVPPAQRNGSVWDIPYEIGGYNGSIDPFPLTNRVILRDSQPPEFLQDLTPPSVGHATVVLFAVKTRDNVDTTGVKLDYWTDPENITSVSMNESSSEIFTHRITAMYRMDPISYRFTARDGSNNTNRTEAKIVRVIDLHPPSVIGDDTPKTATTGDPFTFSIRVKDDNRIEEVRLTYRQLGSEVKKIEMNRSTTDFNTTVIVPHDTSDLLYNFTLMDIAGNVNRTTSGRIGVLDNDPPKAEAGQNVTVRIDERFGLSGNGSYDNIDIESYNWTYVDSIQEKVTGFGENLSGIRFSLTGRYTVFLTVTDAAGNRDTDMTYVTVIGDKTPTTITLEVGRVTDGDGVPLKGVEVTLNLGDDDHENITDVSGYTTFTLPLSSVGSTVYVDLEKSGYEKAHYRAKILPGGKLDSPPPKMNRIDNGQEDGEPVLIIIALGFLILTGMITAVYIFRRSGSEYEE